MIRISSKEVAGFLLLIAAGLGAAQSPARQEASKPVQSLDYEFFKAQVEPIFVKKREGQARCILCPLLLLPRIGKRAAVSREAVSRKHVLDRGTIPADF